METSDLTDERLAELERLAKEATPGPRWPYEWDPSRVSVRGGKGGDDRVLCSLNHNFEYAADVAFLVATDPDTVLALIAEVRRLRGALDESRRLTPYRRGYEDALRGPEVARMTDRLAESQANAAKLKEALHAVRKFDPGACFCAVVADGCMSCILRAALAETEGKP